MIERDTRPGMGRIWSEDNKYGQWLEVESRGGARAAGAAGFGADRKKRGRTERVLMIERYTRPEMGLVLAAAHALLVRQASELIEKGVVELSVYG